MHETHILKNILRYLDEEENKSHRKIKKIELSLSEFSGFSEEHLRQHLKEETSGTNRENLKVEIKKIAFGPELKITKVYYS